MLKSHLGLRVEFIAVLTGSIISLGFCFSTNDFITIDLRRLSSFLQPIAIESYGRKYFTHLSANVGFEGIIYFVSVDARFEFT